MKRPAVELHRKLHIALGMASPRLKSLGVLAEAWLLAKNNDDGDGK